VKRYSVSHVRERLADVLDEAEAGNPVVIERRGVRYVLKVEERPARRQRRRSTIETLDPAVADGQWQWTTTAAGVKFTSRRRS
jgi:antitoxin (DNA-binding transcriptional repressor) of toxin-antitoxin stability system